MQWWHRFPANTYCFTPRVGEWHRKLENTRVLCLNDWRCSGFMFEFHVRSVATNDELFFFLTIYTHSRSNLGDHLMLWPFIRFILTPKMTYMTINTIRIIYQYLTKSMCHVVSQLHHIHQIWPTLPTFFSHFTPAEVDAGRASSNSSQPFRLSASNAAQGRVMGMQCGTHRFSRWPFFGPFHAAGHVFLHKCAWFIWFNWLVLSTPLKNMTSSVGMIIPNIWEHKKWQPNHQPVYGGRSGLRMIICWICDWFLISPLTNVSTGLSGHGQDEVITYFASRFGDMGMTCAFLSHK